MSIDWKVGDVVRRVTEKHTSAMPLGLGVVTFVDLDDLNQPVRIGYWYWPRVEDIVRERTSEEQTRQDIIATAAKHCGLSGDLEHTATGSDRFRGFAIPEPKL